MNNSSIFLLIAFVLTLFAVVANGVVQRVEIFSELGCRGDSIVFTSKEPNLTNFKPFLNDAKSWKGTGYWTGFSSVNYERYLFFMENYNSVPPCWNETCFRSANSLRYHGPEDTATEAVAIFCGSSDYVIGGTEIIFYGESGNKFNFTPTWLTTYGRSVWTIYSNDDYTGRAKCLKSWSQASNFDPGVQGQFQSIRKDCIPKTEQ